MAIKAAIVRIGLDIAKMVFQLHGVDKHDQPRLRKQLPRAKVLEFFAQLPPCEIGKKPVGARTIGGESSPSWAIRSGSWRCTM
jgi:transposase